MFLGNGMIYKIDKDQISYPIGSIPNEKLILCEEDEGPIVYLSDRFGFMNSDKLWNKKNHNILIIGDSHAQGNCVSETSHKILNEKYLLNTLSLGQGGNGPLIALASAQEYLKFYKTDYIYYLMSTNDYSRENFSDLPIDFELEINNSYLQKILYTNYSQDYFKKGSLIKTSIKLKELSNDLILDFQMKKNTWLSSITEFLSLKYFLIKVYHMINPIINQGIRFTNSKDELLLERTIKKISSLNNGKVIFITRANKNCYIRGNNSIEYKYLNNLLKNNNIKENNIINAIDPLCNSEVWSKKGNHLNSKGYNILSEIIFNDYISR